MNTEIPKPQFKKRKLTDKTLPNGIVKHPDFAEDSAMYTSLLEMERKLDWTMTRKRTEIQDTLSRVPTTSRTLRIFMSHTVSSQLWQPSEAGLDMETGQGIPAWVFKIEGRLLEQTNSRTKEKNPRKFSTFVRQMVVEMDRDRTLYPDENIVEWSGRSTNGVPVPITDGFSIRRTGDAPTNFRIVIYLAHHPDQFKLHPNFADILGIKEGSRIGIVQALWTYIKTNELQDKVDRRQIHLNEPLRPLFGGAPSIHFQQIPELINRSLLPSDPIVLRYSIDPSQPPPERPLAWDVEIKTDDVSLKSRMYAVVNASKESSGQLSKLDDEIALQAQSLQNSHLKRAFLTSFAENPAEFIQKWVESQSRDLDNALGSGPTDGTTVRAEDLRRSDFFRLPWVEEAVAVQEGMRLASVFTKAGQ